MIRIYLKKLQQFKLLEQLRTVIVLIVIKTVRTLVTVQALRLRNAANDVDERGILKPVLAITDCLCHDVVGYITVYIKKKGLT